MTREESIEIFKRLKENAPNEMHLETVGTAQELFDMAIQALSQESEIEENIIKYMKKYPNHVGNTDFWEGFYACRNVVLQLDDEECSPKEQEPCDDLISRKAVDKYIARLLSGYLYDGERERLEIFSAYLWELPSVTQKSGKWLKHSYARKCSGCGSVTCWTDDEGTPIPDKYCPNCGAKMESEDKE